MAGESIRGQYTSEEQGKGGNIVNKHFIPVKITDKKWADKLVNGEVYMRALHEFGSWGNVTEKDTVLNNNYRGDFFAGVTATYRTADDSDFFRGFPTEVKAHMANCCLVDESDVRFFKIFSLYRHELDEEKQEFVAPDPRMAQFGTPWYRVPLRNDYKYYAIIKRIGEEQAVDSPDIM